MEERFISKEMRAFISVELAQVILARADARLGSSLEQLRKSTDRAYTMTGFLLTCFTGLTAFMVNTHDLVQFLLALVLWFGISDVLLLMFTKVISVHGFKYAGSAASGYMQDKNIAYARRHSGGSDDVANKIYLKNCLLDSIEYAEEAYHYNRQQLTDRCQVIDKAMRAIKWSVGIDFLIILIVALIKFSMFAMTFI